MGQVQMMTGTQDNNQEGGAKCWVADGESGAGTGSAVDREPGADVWLEERQLRANQENQRTHNGELG